MQDASGIGRDGAWTRTRASNGCSSRHICCCYRCFARIRKECVHFTCEAQCGNSFCSLLHVTSDNSDVQQLLMSRSAAELEDVKTLMQGFNPTITVVCRSMDLVDSTAVESVRAVFQAELPATQTQAIFFNNAGSLGPLQPAASEPSFSSLQTAITLNITAACFLTSAFCQWAKSTCDRITVVNVSSLAAVQGFKTWGTYCAGKAARDMYHKVLSMESPEVRLNEVRNACRPHNIRSQC